MPEIQLKVQVVKLEMTKELGCGANVLESKPKIKLKKISNN